MTGVLQLDHLYYLLPAIVLFWGALLGFSVGVGRFLKWRSTPKSTLTLPSTQWFAKKGVLSVSGQYMQYRRKSSTTLEIKPLRKPTTVKRVESTPPSSFFDQEEHD